MMIIDVPVGPFSPPAKIQEWINQLEASRNDPDAEPSDLLSINSYIEWAQGWLADGSKPESGSAAWRA